MDQSKSTEDFQWEDFIELKTMPDESKILEFIIYNKIGSNEYVIVKCNQSKEQNLEMLKLIQDILNNTSQLTPKQIIDYCKSQRYFMKQYIKHIQDQE